MNWNCPKCGLANPWEAASCGWCGTRPSQAYLADLRRSVDDSDVNDPATSQDSQTPKETFELPLEFRGSAREYFRIWIVNLCLTLLTLGIFSAWAKVRKKRYLYSHTVLGGTPFQYLAQPIPILKGRLIAAAGFVFYFVSSHFFTSLMPFVIAAALIAGPWFVVRSAAFNARYSAFRNMTFHFDATYLDAVKVLYLRGIIPALIMASILFWQAVPKLVSICIFSLVVSYPWLLRRFKNFIIEHFSYGGRKGAFSATGGQFFKIFFLGGLIMLAVLVPSSILVTLLVGPDNRFFPYLILIPNYCGYVLIFAFVQARSGNLVWNHTALAPIRFQSTLRSKDLLKLYLTNALGIVTSLGLLIPWAVMRTMKYRADNMHVFLQGELTEFNGESQGGVSAVAAETVDLFDLDFSL